jgi:hypothetical protein
MLAQAPRFEPDALLPTVSLGDLALTATRPKDEVVARPRSSDVADSWASAPPAARADALASFRAEDAVNFALLTPLNLVFAGFTFVLFGLANASSDVYPRWLGSVAVIGGVGSAISGGIQAYMGELTRISEALGIASPTIITLWLLIIGILLLRSARSSLGGRA